MSTSRVHRLSLKVAHASQLARTKKALAGALGLALDSYGSQRLFIVRKLSLGRIRSAAAPTALRSRIEDDVRRMQSSAIPGTRSDAGRASAVFFEDAVSACIAL